MLVEGDTTDPVRMQRMLTLAWQSLQETQRVFEKLEKLSYVSAGQPEEVQAAAWVRELVGAAKVELASLEAPAGSLRLDAGLWKQILEQLLTNVAEHGEGRCAVVLRAEPDGMLLLEVRDWGPGLGQMLPERAVNVTRRREGSPGVGFGLTVVEWAAMLLGGTLVLEQPADGGIRGRVRARPFSVEKGA